VKPNDVELPRPGQPEPDPKAENARLIGLGNEAFAAGEIGRAAHRFRQAIQVAPNEPRAYFLLAEANIALGKYDEAVDALHSGLRLKPDWPVERFRPSALYGKDDAAFRADLRKLMEARDRHPDEYELNFLSAYLLWFEGRQDEARPLFRKAAAAGNGFAESFLKF
jgi:tetratricopeptide (TPR) repeat protein